MPDGIDAAYMLMKFFTRTRAKYRLRRRNNLFFVLCRYERAPQGWFHRQLDGGE